MRIITKYQVKAEYENLAFPTVNAGKPYLLEQDAEYFAKEILKDEASLKDGVVRTWVQKIFERAKQ